MVFNPTHVAVKLSHEWGTRLARVITLDYRRELFQ